MKKQCTVAIVGLPNAGKSTFLNKAMKQKVAIVSYKPQTTRNQIKTVYEDDRIRICFTDTPGFHQPKNKLDSFLNSQVKQSFKQADLVLLLIDATRDDVEANKILIDVIKSYKVGNLIVVFTHKDLDPKIKLEDKLNLYGLNDVKHKMLIDNNSLQDVNNVISFIYDLAPQDGFFEPSEMTDDFLIQEIIREQALYILKQEVPHSMAVVVDSKNFDKEQNLFTINCSLIVEKESQKPIVIGAGGKMIKLIGSKARQELLKFFDCRIMLKLFVKVKED
ncbi:MAG: GTPase Era [Mycoplasmoidaceae bacterium]|nr:GTPase Era [Mycoplasmoidaceae bacterium]